MPSVRVKDNEPFEMALRRFRRSCEKAGVFTEMRRREHYEKPTEIRKRKAAAARKRELKKLMRRNNPRPPAPAAATFPLAFRRALTPLLSRCGPGLPGSSFAVLPGQLMRVQSTPQSPQ